MSAALAFPTSAPPIRSEGIYLNSATAGLPTAAVLDAMVGHLWREAEIGPAEAAAEQAERLHAAYRAAARLLGAAEDEIALLESGNRALQAAIGAVPLAPGDRVLVTRAEWGGSLAMLSGLRGVSVEPLPTQPDGTLDLAAARAMPNGRVRLVLATWCPAANGLVNPAAEIGALAREAGAFFILDACQAVGQMPVDVRALACDALVASGRKWLRGPRGTAILYASRRFLGQTATPMPDQFGAAWDGRGWTPRPDARRFETGEASFAGRLGLGAAIEGALAFGPERLQARIAQLAALMRDGLRALPGVQVHDAGSALSGIVSFTLDGMAAGAAQEALRQAGVSLAARGAAYAPLDMAARGLAEVLRAAPHVFNSGAEIAAALDAVARLATRR
ncbi:aminotransferase class V-fold PLP-dependent enzyme [Paracraurococcus lichenis]|uniref:Aminotransferase class V-fold PLP-dependent enzyme n=1 Tax=Paracraurococcus lichenis TaxID=3064888 RepID=A0ABT9EAK9_9PROT|nr:aminotransferase class V-fold PLP-dependent enzyme [Paracraurococcus sp. LOR1-02]MDO9713226.1 aminotransferase class V-fold PLP-dependent enzyme [Paracraurococcus sp. LOR1-02]